MKRTPRICPVESYKWSLRLSLHETAGKEVCPKSGEEFYCSAPTHELEDRKIPKQLDLLLDFECGHRVWFDLRFEKLIRDKWGDLRALYSAQAN